MHVRYVHSTLTYGQGIKESQYGSMVFYNARLLDAFHKLLLLHVLFRQLEALHGALFVPVAMARALPLLVPLDPADKTFKFRPPVRLGRYFVNHYCSPRHFDALYT